MDIMPFHSSVITNNPEQRTRVLSVLQAALHAVDPGRAIQAVLRRDGSLLRVGDRGFALDRFRRISVIGAGKAGAPMALAVEAVIGDHIGRGLVVVKTGHASPTQHVEIVEAGHPVPDRAGVAAGRRILAMAQEAGEDELVIALISGGGSALLEAPAEISLADLQAMTACLLASGASINEMNCLRKHMSLLKGGQLARAVSPATLVTLILSDVVGSPLDVIASGPTVPDDSTWADAWAVVEKYDLADDLPPGVVQRLRAGMDGQIADTPKADDAVFAHTQTVIVGDNRVAALAACAHAEVVGYHTLLLTTFLEGEAKEVGILAAALGREIVASGHPLTRPACLVMGGETTVTLGAAAGRGGRNQELALAAALALKGSTGVTVAALATDGTDGPTDGAGAIVDGATVARGAAKNLDAGAHLRSHNAYPFLRATGDLLISGPTQTNVNDLLCVFVE